jgi:hypothetical protein
MTPVPLDLPLRPAEATEIASLIFDLAERKPLTDDLRNRIAARAAPLKLESLTPCFGSLVRDPVHHSSYYLAIDVKKGPPQLLHMALATAPTSSVFDKALLIGRVRSTMGLEVLINAVPFGPSDTVNIDQFAAKIEPSVPVVTGSATTLFATGPEAGFEAFRSILKRTRKNVAGIAAPYHTAVWAAIRAGWRHGYGAAVELRVSDEISFHIARETIRQFPCYSRFMVSASLPDVQRLSAQIRQARSSAKLTRPFELGISLEDRFATPDELALCLQKLQDAGHPTQVAAVKLEAAQITGMAAVARRFNCILSVAADDQSGDDLRRLAGEPLGRLSCTVCGNNTRYIEELAETLLR